MKCSWCKRRDPQKRHAAIHRGTHHPLQEVFPPSGSSILTGPPPRIQLYFELQLLSNVILWIHEILNDDTVTRIAYNSFTVGECVFLHETLIIFEVLVTSQPFNLASASTASTCLANSRRFWKNSWLGTRWSETLFAVTTEDAMSDKSWIASSKQIK